MKVLVTGGAGYVGSHVVLQLAEQGHTVVVVDDLSTGVRSAVIGAELAVLDIGSDRCGELIAVGGFDAVMHFAASVVVPESVEDPCKYYFNNTVNTLRLLRRCCDHGVRHVILSSTAAVYGIPQSSPVAETVPLHPINPYGASKLMCETMLADIARASDLSYIALRYFNVAGADLQRRIGQQNAEATHLVKTACRAATGEIPGMSIFGTDYDTPDGSCVRDYIHVLDIADAHLRALEHLVQHRETMVLNCGYGHGSSVREVVNAAKRVTGVDFPVTEAARRAGDPPELVADNRAIRSRLGWTPGHDDLNEIIASAWRWEQSLARASGNGGD